MATISEQLSVLKETTPGSIEAQNTASGVAANLVSAGIVSLSNLTISERSAIVGLINAIDRSGTNADLQILLRQLEP